MQEHFRLLISGYCCWVSYQKFYRKSAKRGTDEQNKRSHKVPKSIAIAGSSLADRTRAKTLRLPGSQEVNGSIPLCSTKRMSNAKGFKPLASSYFERNAVQKLKVLTRGVYLAGRTML